MQDILSNLGLNKELSGAYGSNALSTSGELLKCISPINGEVIAEVKMATLAEYHQVVAEAHSKFAEWRMIPAPQRGEIVRQMGDALRKHKNDLGKLVTLEMGKIVAEGEGEVQEMIDIADFAVGLSRQLYGLHIASERPQHTMTERYQPLGTVGIISAFNFPVAVWAWNGFLAAVCGDTMVWKPSLKTPLTAIAVHKLMNQVLTQNGFAGVMGLVIGPDDTIGETMIKDKRLPLISATGSTRMGRHVSQVVAERFGKSLLELGGNNALVVMDDADFALALPAVLFGSVGTAGQRCTTTRRLLLHKSIAADFTKRLTKAYKDIKIGNPLHPDTLMGPLIDQDAIDNMQAALTAAKEQGAEILIGGEVLAAQSVQTAKSAEAVEGGFYVKPAIVKAKRDLAVMQNETFAPILYIVEFASLNEAIDIQNSVQQGLSSAIFTDSIKNGERFLSACGSDCGIANVNIGTSGAEIGGAFGGEKETGGGREAGSDAWKAYMRRQTQTVNWSTELPLAQGIKFG